MPLLQPESINATIELGTLEHKVVCAAAVRAEASASTPSHEYACLLLNTRHHSSHHGVMTPLPALGLSRCRRLSLISIVSTALSRTSNVPGSAVRQLDKPVARAVVWGVAFLVAA